MIPVDLSGKKALVMGVANARSIAWGIAEKLHQAGATLAFSYQGERLKDEVEKLTAGFPGVRRYELDVTNEQALKAMMADIKAAWGGLDYILHSIAFAPRAAMEGRYIETSREDWMTALEVSTYSLLSVTREAEGMLSADGSIVTMSFYAAEKVVPKYNVMGIAKSALEANVRYLAYDLGPKGVRVNAISAGPVRTIASRSIPGFIKMFDRAADIAPLKRNVTLEEVGNLGLFLLSPMSSGITGETIYVDAGYHIMGMDLSE